MTFMPGLMTFMPGLMTVHASIDRSCQYWPLWPPLGLLWPPLGSILRNTEKFSVFSRVSLFFPKFRVLDPSVEARTRTTVRHQWSTVCALVHYPGYHYCCTTAAHVRVAGYTTLSRGNPRFAKLLWSIVNTSTVANPHIGHLSVQSIINPCY